MKSHVFLIASVLLALTSCGTTASLTQAPAQQKYQDGIYYRPQTLSLDAQAAQLTATDDLIARTKSSAVFVKTVGKVDTLFIPENMSASIKFNHRDSTTTVSLYDDYDLGWWRWNTSFSPRYGYSLYSPFYIGSYRWYRDMYWGWYDPFWYDPFWYDPFWGPYWSIGFGPFWHDPFFYSPYYYAGGPWGWYDPFYWGYPYYYGGGGGAYFGPRYRDRELATRSGHGTLIPSSPRGGVGRVVGVVQDDQIRQRHRQDDRDRQRIGLQGLCSCTHGHRFQDVRFRIRIRGCAYCDPHGVHCFPQRVFRDQVSIRCKQGSVHLDVPLRFHGRKVFVLFRIHRSFWQGFLQCRCLPQGRTFHQFRQLLGSYPQQFFVRQLLGPYPQQFLIRQLFRSEPQQQLFGQLRRRRL